MRKRVVMIERKPLVGDIGGQLDPAVNTVFNYPTLAECYKNAALDGINRLSA